MSYTCSTPIELTATREGDFVVQSAKLAEHQCGKKFRTYFEYEVSISGINSKFSKEGFLVDHNVIAKYFDSTYGASCTEECPSCEIMICRAIEFFKTALADVCDLTRISIKIRGSKEAYVTGVWSRLSKHQQCAAKRK